MKDQFDEKMDANRPEQTVPAREAMFARVMKEVSTPTVVPSPFIVWLQKPTRTVVLGAFGVFLIIGMGGTVAAAETAKPGDWLFPVDRATEELRLFLTDETKRIELETKFLDERLQELEAVVRETKTRPVTSRQTTNVDTDQNDQIDLVIEAFLAQTNRVDTNISTDRRQTAASLLETIKATFPGRLERVRIEDDRIEIRTDELRVRERDGVMEVEYRHNDDDGDDRDGDDDRSFTNSGDDSHGSGSKDAERNDDGSHQLSGEGGDGDSGRDDRNDNEISRDDEDNNMGDNDDEKETDDDDNSGKDDDDDKREDDDRSGKEDDH